MVKARSVNVKNTTTTDVRRFQGYQLNHWGDRPVSGRNHENHYTFTQQKHVFQTFQNLEMDEQRPRGARPLPNFGTCKFRKFEKVGKYSKLSKKQRRYNSIHALFFKKMLRSGVVKSYIAGKALAEFTSVEVGGDGSVISTLVARVVL